MTIETKFNIYDNVWIMYNDKPVETTIVGIMICKTSSKCQLSNQISYYLDITSDNIIRNETSLFNTKQELLSSL